jgi:TolA-binding protein
MGLFGRFIQHQKFDDTKREARRSAADAADAKDQVRELQERVDELSLVLNAMWVLVQEQTDLDDEDLARKLSELSLEREGASHEPAQCAQCGRPLSSRHPKCMYCGAEKQGGSVFDPK